MIDWRVPKCRRIAIAVGCLCGMISNASAQEPKTGEIHGLVVDSVGATIAEAAVFVHKSSPPEDNTRLIAHTDAHGDFVLMLPEGAYDVLVTCPHFFAEVATIPLLAGKTKKIRFKLKAQPCDFAGMNCDTF